MIKAVAHTVAHAEVLGLCLREQLVTYTAHFKFQSMNLIFPILPMEYIFVEIFLSSLFFKENTRTIAITQSLGVTLGAVEQDNKICSTHRVLKEHSSDACNQTWTKKLTLWNTNGRRKWHGLSKRAL